MNIFESHSKVVKIYGFLQHQHEFPPPKLNTILHSPQKAILFQYAFLENHYDA